jgi:uncharacterized protein
MEKTGSGQRARLDMIPRSAPDITEESLAFWTSGADSLLMIARCQDCSLYIHPPVPVCRRCRSLRVTPEAVSGAGTIYSFTVNYQQWSADPTAPFVVALVELVEQPGLRITTNLDLPIEEVVIGMDVEVFFFPFEGSFLPVFRGRQEAL